MKRKKIIIIVIIILLLIESFFLFLMYKSFSNKKTGNLEINKNEVKRRPYAIMLEQDDGSYKKSDEWPNNRYVYSETLSGCIGMNGNKTDGILTYDEKTNEVSVDTTETSFCYLYFDLKICEFASDSSVSAGEYGAKYNCKVDPNKDAYTFYLLDNNEDGTSDLIMSHNINAAGEKVIPNESSDLGLVKWYADDYDNSYGPIDAMAYLYKATKSWTNVEPVSFEYFDKEVQGNKHGYTSFISLNGIATITARGGQTTTIGTVTEPLRARMPVYIKNQTNSSLNEIVNIKLNPFLYNNLDNWEYNGPNGYWTMSSDPDIIGFAFDVDASGSVIEGYVYFGNDGVRPVITLKL